jgi:hypothetical protein
MNSSAAIPSRGHKRAALAIALCLGFAAGAVCFATIARDSDKVRAFIATAVADADSVGVAEGAVSQFVAVADHDAGAVPRFVAVADHDAGAVPRLVAAAAGGAGAVPRQLAAASPAPARGAAASATLDANAAARFANLALSCLHREYPNKIAHVLDSDKDALPPHVLTPAFYGCYDWHSDVHGHWLLVRLARLYPDAPFASRARAEVARSLTAANIAGEVAYLKREDRASFERPYGLAWLLQLSAELRQWRDPQAQQWAATIQPLEAEAATRLKSWLPKLHYPIRIGEHDQTAFSFGLLWDWAGVAGDTQMRQLLTDAAQRFYRADRDCPLRYEPSGQDFLSPCLAEADFMRRVLDREHFRRWLQEFLPGIPDKVNTSWLQPAVVTDRSDPKLAHIDGLNLSRAWMLEGIAHSLGNEDHRASALLAAARAHRKAALAAVTGEHYEGGHWLGTFAVYLTSEAGR